MSTYEPKFWYGEAISLLHKLFFTGVIHLIAPGTRMQIWAGTLSSIMVLMLFILTSPFKFDVCDWVQGAALIQLMLTYASASLVSGYCSLRHHLSSCVGLTIRVPFGCLPQFFDDGSSETTGYRTDSAGVMLIVINCSCFMVLLLVTWTNIVDERRKLARNQLRYKDTDLPAQPRPLAKGIKYHLFLSHIWRNSGQDVMRTVKERMLEVLPGLEIFLDVDIEQLQIGQLEQYIVASDTIVVLCTKGYFDR